MSDTKHKFKVGDVVRRIWTTEDGRIDYYEAGVILRCCGNERYDIYIFKCADKSVQGVVHFNVNDSDYYHHGDYYHHNFELVND